MVFLFDMGLIKRKCNRLVKEAERATYDDINLTSVQKKIGERENVSKVDWNACSFAGRRTW